MKLRTGVLLLLGCAFIALLVVRAMNYARKTAPKATTNVEQPAAQVPSPATPKAAEPVQADVKLDASGTPVAGVPLPADWKQFSVDEYGFQIGYPANWPAKLDGNVLTIGDTEGDGHTKCYLTVEFQGSKGSGQIIPAPTTHIAYEQIEKGDQCNAMLSKIVKSGKFVK